MKKPTMSFRLWPGAEMLSGNIFKFNNFFMMANISLTSAKKQSS
jgi:hypothetical protein